MQILFVIYVSMQTQYLYFEQTFVVFQFWQPFLDSETLLHTESESHTPELETRVGFAGFVCSYWYAGRLLLSDATVLLRQTVLANKAYPLRSSDHL